MPVEMGIWKLGDKLEKVPCTSIDSEARLEEALEADLDLLSPPKYLLIGRQVATTHGNYCDLLAMDADGNLCVIELKRNRTPREVVAQLLDYGSWVKELAYEDILELYSEKNQGRDLEEGFAEAFGSSPPEGLSQGHRLIVVASGLDPATERIIGYLSDTYGVPINAVFFWHFQDGPQEYIARSWLVDPVTVEAKAQHRGREPWNGRDFYVSFGEDENRSWKDACRYGFISAGGGRWYTGTLQQLFLGARVFVNIPRTGYVGVGVVKEPAVPVRDFLVSLEGREMSLLEAPKNAAYLADRSDDPEHCEQAVRVEWIKTLPREQAHWEKGMFANQNTVCRLRNRFTLE